MFVSISDSFTVVGSLANSFQGLPFVSMPCAAM